MLDRLTLLALLLSTFEKKNKKKNKKKALKIAQVGGRGPR
jgi:hypothetical protein